VDLRLLKDVNELWTRIYPYLADQVMEYYGRSDGDILELGPFVGGISTLAVQDSGMVDSMRGKIEGARLDREIALRCSELDNLVFADSVFDLVIFRGAYFFLDEEGGIIREIYRVLREDGLAFITDFRAGLTVKFI
jgi:SAM-dependent methyltransferase